VAVTRYCPNCGLERREGERFCRNCGHALGTGETSLHESPLTASAPAATPAEPTAPNPPVRHSAPPAPGSEALPAPPSAPHAIPTTPRVRSTPLPMKPVAFAGGLAMILAVFLPWISLEGSSANALDVPLQALWDPNAADGAVKLGFVILLLGAVGAGLSFMPNTTRYRRLAGSIGLAVSLAFALQLYRSVDEAGGSFVDAVSAIGFGVVLALTGSIALQVSK
jgi:hypothetical protein